MLSDKDLLETIQDLQSEDVKVRARMLRLLTTEDDDPRLLPYIEPLLEDKTVCIVHIPIHYGEIRYLAATALAEVRAAVGIWEKVCVEVVAPLNVTELYQIAEAAGVKKRYELPGDEGTFDLFIRLREMGKLPMATIELDPVEEIESAKRWAEFRAQQQEAEEKEDKIDTMRPITFHIRQADGTWKKY
ncbi:hypothetical protein [Anthocerotibacter panamensis]|uniref:hypothetical protein n=1 Tax=Anthocerotibacter panamensis TaxID=2857077 RepID=UPI001C403B71|nr:hypothetical protein [Anthocerotibacter panamensis]